MSRWWWVAGVVVAGVLALAAFAVASGTAPDRDPADAGAGPPGVGDPGVGDPGVAAADPGTVTPEPAVPTGPPGTSGPSGPSGPQVTASPEVTHETLWLCGPRAADDICLDDLDDLDATVVAADGTRTVEPFVPAADPPADCFYVYPTVSSASARNAPLEVTDDIVRATRLQAARFGEVCRVVAPVYRQLTLQGLLTGGFADQTAREIAFGDVLSAWNDHLTTAGDRPFVLVGHSQGAQTLTRLLAERIEGDPALRARLVAAMLVGGQVEVPAGEDVGGSFSSIPACRAAEQVGCVVAYNSYADAPSGFTLFGRARGDREVLCVHPAAPAGGSAPLHPYLPADGAVPGGSGVETTFVAPRGSAEAECRSDDGSSWLEVDLDPSIVALAGAAGFDLGPAWGLHAGDVNLALGDLVELVRGQIATHAAGGDR